VRAQEGYSNSSKHSFVGRSGDEPEIKAIKSQIKDTVKKSREKHSTAENKSDTEILIMN